MADEKRERKPVTPSNLLVSGEVDPVEWTPVGLE